MSLVAFLAWVGLGADGLSSSSYGPSEAFGALGEYRFLAIPLALAMVVTVFIISSCYSHLIEAFPSGGGGYLVATKLLGPRIGVVSGAALMVDYVLTVTVSIAAAGDAIFGLIGKEYHQYQLPAEAVAILVLIVLNLRGVKESIQILLPIFITFLITHIILIVGAFFLNVPEAGKVTAELTDQFRQGMHDPKVGIFGMLGIVLFAYSLGAGTYTGLEAVSNSLSVLREPRVATAKKTMRYMAISLSLMAGGLIVVYLLLDIRHSVTPTMNNLLAEKWLEEIKISDSFLGKAFLWTTLLSEGALLFVAAQASFIGGPRVLANMAQDSWVPRWFANLSERLATHNGILLIGFAALLALWYTHGDIQVLVVMYSINVFVTFSLSMIGMCKYWFRLRTRHPLWFRRIALFGVGSALCVGILCVSIFTKFWKGGWVTVAATGVCVIVCFPHSSLLRSRRRKPAPVGRNARKAIDRR